MSIINEDAFNKIVSEHYNSILKYFVFKTNSIDDAHELTQDVFLALTENWDTLIINDKTDYKRWLYAVAGNKLKNYYKQKKRQSRILYYDDDELKSRLDTELSYLVDFEDELIQQCFSASLTEEISDIITQLNSDQKELFDLVYIQKISYRDITKKYGKSEVAIRMRISRLKTQILRIIKAYINNKI